MTLCCGIDLHSNNHVVVVIDEEDRRIVEKRVSNSIERTVALLAPYREQIAGIAVESTFNWYWLVDGLMDQGHLAPIFASVSLCHPLYESVTETEGKSRARQQNGDCLKFNPSVPFFTNPQRNRFCFETGLRLTKAAQQNKRALRSNAVLTGAGQGP
jgi:hypothetical protein